MAQPSPTLCTTPSGQMLNIDRLSGNDLTADFAMRYRLASDPDVDGSYTPVTTTKNFLGLTIPYFDIYNMSNGLYVVHTYDIVSGKTTGTKITLNVACTDPGAY